MTALLTPKATGYVMRPYQERGINMALRAIANGKQAPLIVAPTGCGKMLVAAEILRRASAKGNTALFAVHRREMVQQCSEKLDAMGVQHGLILPGHKPGNLERTYVGTVQSYTARTRSGSFDPDNVRVIVIDEAHHATANTYKALRDAYPNAVVVGLTATPTRADGTGLGNVFDDLVQCITYSEALERGYLVKPRYYAPYTPDLANVSTRAGDYADDELEREMNRPQLVGDIVQHYARHAADRQGIVFATRVRHSIALAEEFTRAGFSAFHIDGTTPTQERDELMEAFRAGELQVMVNVGVATEGLDVPNVGAVVLARPTKSVSLHMQMVGRALRPAAGKSDCIAEGELVLTDAGLVPIEQVTTAMKVWDGLNWVTHDGPICKGEQEVITYAGLTATPDHRVWTQEGWRALGECAQQQIPIAQTGLGGQAVRLSAGCFVRSAVEGEEAEPAHVCFGRVHDLPTTDLDYVHQPHGRENQGLPQLQPASPRAALVAQSDYGNEAALHQPGRLPLHGLRGERDSVQVRLPPASSHVDSGEFGLAQRDAVGPGGQQRPLRSGQPSLVNSGAEPSAYPKDPGFLSTAPIPERAPGSEVRRQHAAADARAADDLCGDMRTVRTAVLQTKRRVWDLVNAGPLHRFTVSGLLAHNCLVLDHAGNTVRLGPVEQYEHWSLDTKKGKKKGKKEERDPKEITCEMCSAVFYSSKICPQCGYAHEYERAPLDIEVADGELVELGTEKSELTLAEKQAWYRQLLAYADAQTLKPGWAYHAYKRRFGVYPKWGQQEMRLRPSAEVLAWAQSERKRQRIAYAKSKAKEQQQKGSAA